MRMHMSIHMSVHMCTDMFLGIKLAATDEASTTELFGRHRRNNTATPHTHRTFDETFDRTFDRAFDRAFDGAFDGTFDGAFDGAFDGTCNCRGQLLLALGESVVCAPR